MMRAVATLVGLVYMGYHDWKKREFEDKPIWVLWALCAIPTLAEYIAVYLVNPASVAVWGAVALLVVAGVAALWKLGYAEDGDVLALAFTLFLNVVSPLEPFSGSSFVLLILGSLSAVSLYQVAWWKRWVTVDEVLANPLRYVYDGGVETIDKLREKSKLPQGSFTLDVAIPKLREMKEKGELTGSERVRVQLAAPLATHLLAAYLAALLLDYLVF